MSTLGRCGGLERIVILTVSLWEGVVILKELIFKFILLERVWW